MAIELSDAVRHGEIDNTVEGKTTGRIWLHGREDPLELELAGDCWRDLAGTRLTFQNTTAPPTPPPAPALAAVQQGVVGDMTASRRVLVDEEFPEESDGSPPPRDTPGSWKNQLYLEWFSAAEGRVLIEAYDFELELSERVWAMDADAENAQKLANLQAMRDYMATTIKRSEWTAGDDEFAWEERLKESDRLTDAYTEVQEKYADDPESQIKEAFVMGWDGLLDAMAREEEGLEDDDDEIWFDIEDFEDPLEGFSPDPDDDEEEGDPGEEIIFYRHPLQEAARGLLMRARSLTQTGEPHPAADSLLRALAEVSGKMAGALNGSGYARENGFVLALLKRCLNWQNDAISASQELIGSEADPDHRRAWEAVREAIFMLREATVNLRKELKEN